LPLVPKDSCLPSELSYNVFRISHVNNIGLCGRGRVSYMKHWKKQIIAVILAAFFCGCHLSNTAVTNGVIDKTENEHVRWGLPGTNGKLLYRLAYVELYDKEKKEPLWVSYHLTKDRLFGTQKRSDKFEPDPDLSYGDRAELSDYYRSGYDRGHMCPAADNVFNFLAMKECFYLSNMIPQKHSLNNGKWKELEVRIRNYVKAKDEAWVISGPIFQKVNEEDIKKIGRVWVPTHCYKIVAYNEGSELKAVGFIMRNDNETADLTSYVLKIKDIEEVTGLDFFKKLSEDSDKRVVEAVNKAGEFWDHSNFPGKVTYRKSFSY